MIHLDLELVRSLRTREARLGTGLYTIEGVRFLIAAADARAEIVGLVVCKRLLTSVIGRMIVRRLRRNGVPMLSLDTASGATLVGATPSGNRAFHAYRYRGPTVLLVGSERTGIRPELRDECDALVQIPMHGRVDSLNVAVAGSLVLYEIFSQRDRQAACAIREKTLEPSRGRAIRRPDRRRAR